MNPVRDHFITYEHWLFLQLSTLVWLGTKLNAPMTCACLREYSHSTDELTYTDGATPFFRQARDLTVLLKWHLPTSSTIRMIPNQTFKEYRYYKEVAMYMAFDIQANIVRWVRAVLHCMIVVSTTPQKVDLMPMWKHICILGIHPTQAANAPKRKRNGLQNGLSFFAPN